MADDTERWTWAVVYEDATVLREIDGEPWAAVDLERVNELAFVPEYEGLKMYVVRADRQAGERVTFFRRRIIPIGTDEGHATIHVGGIKRQDGTASYIFLYEDGSCLLATDLNAV